MQLFRHQTQAGAATAHRKSRGQSLVEFALVLPVLMLILLITIDFGRVFLGWVTLNNAARIAANYAASGTPPLVPSQVTEYHQIVARETSGINCDTLTVPDPTYDPTTPMVGGRAIASIKCTFHLITPFLGALFPGNVLPVSASSDFPIRSGVLANLVAGGPPVAGAPNQDFTITPPTGPLGTNFNFSLLPQLGGPAQTWLWNFGDGTDITPNPPAHTYGSAGTYTVTLTETNGAGSSSHQHDVIVGNANPLPVAGFYGTVPDPCQTISVVGAPNSEQCGGSSGADIFYTWPMTVNFTNTSTGTGGATYSWNFGDGSTDTTSSPSHTYSTPGVFEVSLTVTTAAGSASTSKATYVNAGCVVPVFADVNTSSAGNKWTAAHFATSGLNYADKSGSTWTYSTALPSPAYKIELQNPQGGLFLTAVDNGGGIFSCSPGAVPERVGPKNANPAP